ncbi:MAG: nSTAND1 domain-containing NTPase [Acidimicrobiales bacterium]
MAGEHPDPEWIHDRDDLARELTALRRAAGLTVRDLARTVDAPVATLGDYFAGRHVPGARQVPLFRAMLDACGVQDPALMAQWVAALTRVRYATDGRVGKGRVPYRGLDAFREVDVDLYFGRQQAVEELLDRLRDAARTGAGPGGSAMAVVGPSGSGKTSLLMAGLLPAVRAGALDGTREGWRVESLVPEQLADGHRAGSPGDGSVPRLVVVDQLEAALMLQSNQRAVVLEAIETLCETSLVVLGLRADFYHAAVSERALLPALRNQLILAPMTPSELRDAVVGPVREVGGGIDDGLVDLILAELSPGSPEGFAHELGALPLLSYALLATWDRAARNHLTIADYQAVGGLRGAVRQAAEELFAALTGPERDQARRMFGRLVRIEGDAPPTRRRASREELLAGVSKEDGDAARAVVERFLAARLVTADAQTVQISHEALLGAWPRLGEWVSSDRGWLRVHHQVADAARGWEESDHDESLLWRGTRLETTLEMAASPGRERDLNRRESEFLQASADYRDEQVRAGRRRTRRTHQLLVAIATLAIAAGLLAGVAIDARVHADQARNQALSRQVAVESQQLQPTDPSLAAQLALAAYQISPTVQARSALVDATAGEIPTRLLGPVGPEFVATSSNAHLLGVAQSATDTVALYRLSSSAPIKLALLRAGPASQQDFAIAISPDGRLLAVGGTGRTVDLWNIADPSRPVRLATLGHLGGTIYSLAFTSRGARLAAGDSGGSVHQWALDASGRPVAQRVLSVQGGDAVKAVAYSPHGTWLAAAGQNGTLDLWRTGDPAPLVAPGTGGADFESIAFEPAGTTFAVGIGNDDTIETWRLRSNGQLQLAHGPIAAASSEVTSTVYSPNGSILAEAAADGTLHIYDAQTMALLASFGDPDPITSLAFAAGGRSLVSADSGGVTRIWQMPPPSTYAEPGNVFSLGYALGGRFFVAGSGGPAGGVTIWSDANPLRPTRVVDVAMPAGFGAAAGASAVSPNGRLLAVGNATAQIRLFDLADLRHPFPIGPTLHAVKPYIEQLGFSPDGKLLVAGDDSGHVSIWNVADPAKPRPFPPFEQSPGEVIGFSFSPAGRLLATASSDTKVRIYDISHPGRPRRLASLGGFSTYAYDTAITPNGRTLIAGSAGGTIRMWDIADPSRPRLIGPRLSIPTGYVYALAVSPDGRTLAAASTTHEVWLWNIADPAHPQLLETLGAAKDEVFAVAFNPDNRVLVASGSDNTVHLWDYQPQDAARRVCALAGAPITRKEWALYVQGANYRPPCG